MTYNEYLREQHWLDTRILKMIHADFLCEKCGKPGTEIHHLHYASLWREKMSDLLLLCRPCHSAFHLPVGGPVASTWQSDINTFIDDELQRIDAV
jgi:5-methylcytosine-specific restriction endonuclease McrA